MKKKSIVYSTTLLLLLGLCSWGGFALFSYFEESTAIKETGEGEAAEAMDRVAKAREEVATGKENGSVEVDLDWSEMQALDVMHKMTHQKVKATEKWGSIQMTHERIRILLDVFGKHPGWEHSAWAIEQLEKWDNNAFVNCVDVHNKIWGMQDGTVGEATGLLNHAEEQKFIEEHFE